MLNKILLVTCCLIVSIAQAIPEQNNSFSEAQKVNAIFKLPIEKYNLARIKLSIDKMVDPSIQINSNLRVIDKMVTDVKGMISANASSMDKMLALKKYLYEKGVWNNYQIFQYDFADPLGTKMVNKMLSNYLATKKGNCITMPLLFIILGDKLGLNVTASTAPLHFFVKFTEDETGKTYNLETTSGANFTREIWYRQQMPMTEQAIQSGIYMQTLTKKETVAVMVSVLGEHFFKLGEYDKAIGIFEIVLSHYPKSVYAMLKSGGSYYRMLKKRFIEKYPDPNQIPVNQRKLFQHLGAGNRYYFSMAEKLGWREPPKDFDEQYLQKVYQDAKYRQ